MQVKKVLGFKHSFALSFCHLTQICFGFTSLNEKPLRSASQPSSTLPVRTALVAPAALVPFGSRSCRRSRWSLAPARSHGYEPPRLRTAHGTGLASNTTWDSQGYRWRQWQAGFAAGARQRLSSSSSYSGWGAPCHRSCRAHIPPRGTAQPRIEPLISRLKALRSAD